MARLSGAVLVLGITVGLASSSAAQFRGGGSAVPGSPAAGTEAAPAPAPGANSPGIPPLGPVFTDPSQRRPPASSARFRSRLVRRPGAVFYPPDPFGGLWFGYWSFYPFGPVEFAPDTAAPFEAQDGVPTGGLQLDVEPRRALVYVDGSYAGIAGTFSGYYHNLELPAGPHRLDLLLTGYAPQTLSVVVTPGRTITYRGSLGSVTKVD